MIRFPRALPALLLALAAPALAQDPPPDRHAGYYYPVPTSTETYESRMQSLAEMDRAHRIQFATAVSQGTLQSSYRVPYAVFAKGGEADRLIVVGLQPGEMSTIFRIRAVLANMTNAGAAQPVLPGTHHRRGRDLLRSPEDDGLPPDHRHRRRQARAQVTIR